MTIRRALIAGTLGAIAGFIFAQIIITLVVIGHYALYGIGG